MEPSRTTIKMINIYADLNCPFCYAQNERLQNEPMGDQVCWNYVEHAQEIITQANTEAQLELLEFETEMVKQRAPDVVIKNPGFRVNTRLAILTLIAFSQRHPDMASALRLAIYRAYWQEGEDISNFGVLERLIKQVGGNMRSVTDEAEHAFQMGQNQWLHGEMDLRIPAMKSLDNRKLLGLQNIYNVQNFVSGLDVESEEGSYVCTYRASPLVAIINMPDTVEMFKRDISEFEVLSLTSMAKFLAHPENNEVKAVIFKVNADDEFPWEELHALRESGFINHHLPAIAVIDKKSRSTIKQGYLIGATDIFEISDIDEYFAPCLKSRTVRFGVLDVLTRDASVDGLTGLYNKRFFNQLLEKEWRRSCRGKLSLSMIILDIDYFKNYNDFYGHVEGDDCLKQVASIISQQLIRPSDMAIRFGGEEFILLLPETDKDGLETVMVRLKQAFTDAAIPHNTNPDAPFLSVSQGGIYAHPHSDNTPLEMLKKADLALYHSKDAGRNCFHSTDYPAPVYD